MSPILRLNLRGAAAMAFCLPLILPPLAIGCTAAQRSTAGTVLSVVGQDGPIICDVIPGLSGTACGPVAQDVSDVAKLIRDILSALPKASAPPSSTLAGIVVRGVLVQGPADQIARVRAALGVDAGAR